MSESIDLVSAALVAAQGEMPSAAFDSQNPFLRNRYASLGSIIAASRPVLAKHGLAVMQAPGTTDTTVSVCTTIVHKSGQSLPGGILHLPIGEEKGKSRAQVAGSIITYLRRYAWASVLGMYADEDTDGNEPGGHQEHSRHATPRTHSPEPPKAPEANSDAGRGTPEATPAFRMRALHRLKAAPGEENRAVVAHFLTVRGWIKGDQHPEDWDLAHVPKNLAELTALGAEISQFAEEQMRLQNPPQGAE